MTFDIKSIRKTKSQTPARILIYGEHKIGKSTWASQAPGAIFIPTEDGQENLDAHAFPLCKTWDDVMGAISALYTEPHAHKTVVVDSIDWAQKLANEHVCRENDKKGIEDFGYGKGYTFSSELFTDLLSGLNALRTERQMQVILICHAEVKTFNDPMADSYDRYQIKVHKNIAKMVQEWCDVIGFAQQDSTTKEEDQGFSKKRTVVRDLARRVLRLAPNAAYDAGNRYDLPATLPLVWADFEAALMKART
jgi:hypothetical protein